MEAESVEEYLEEKLFGSKEAVSTTLLSFELGHTLAEAVRALQSFYDSHRDALDASFKVRTQEDARISIKVVSARDLDTYGADKGQIWIVSPQGANDKVVIATVSARVQQLQCGLSIGRLKYLGLTTNPLLESDFTISNGGNKTSYRNAENQATDIKQPHAPEAKAAVPKEVSPKPSNASNESPSASSISEPMPKKVKTEDETNKKDTEKPKPRQPSKPTSGFFTKVNKADALKSIHKRTPEPKPVHEAVVMGHEPNDDDLDGDDGTETETANKASKEEQLRKLKESMFKEESSDEENNVEDPDQEMEDNMDIDVGADEMDADMGDDPLETNATSDDPDSGAQIPQDSADEGKDYSGKNTNEESESGPSPENQRNLAATESRNPERPQTRRVRKIVVRKDEEGFDVHEEVWEDVPIDSVEGQPETLAKEHNESQSKKDAETKPAPETKPTPETKPAPETKKTAKAPPKLPAGQKKQKTLMSFFGKK